jgi:hypothetical protein
MAEDVSAGLHELVGALHVSVVMDAKLLLMKAKDSR